LVEIGATWYKPRLAELALDVVFAGEAEAAVELQAGVGGLPARLGGQVLGHVGLRAAGLCVSNRRQASQRIRSAASTSMCASAIGNCTPWFWPIGRPKTTRSLT
jgi:hypothetical protein